MTSRQVPQCALCVHLRVDPERTCSAYPGGIPDDIWWNRADHRSAQEGDGGVRWSALDGADFPDYAMVAAVPAPVTAHLKGRHNQESHGGDGDIEAVLDGLDEISAGQVKAAGADVTPGHDELHHYWTKGEGLAKWATSTHPWTALVRHLTKHVGRSKAEVFASKWFHEVFGIWPGERKGKNPAGPG